MNTVKRNARITGLFYLIIFFTNIFAYFMVSQSLSVAGDAVATANNIMASESLYRAGIASYLIVFLSDIGVAILLYGLLKPVSKTLSMFAMFTRLIQTAVHGVNLLNFIFPLILLNGGAYLSTFSTAQIHSLVLLFLDAHHYGTLISEAFFAVSLFLLAYLIYRSDYFPRIFGILLIPAALGYFLDSFGIFLLPQYETLFAQLVAAPAILGEFSFTLWLLIKGVKKPTAGTMNQTAQTA